MKLLKAYAVYSHFRLKIMRKTNLGNLHSPFDDIKKSSQLQNSPNMGIFYAQLLMSSAQNNHVSCGTSTKNLI